VTKSLTIVKGQQESPLVASEFPTLVAAWRTAAAGMAAQPSEGFAVSDVEVSP